MPIHQEATFPVVPERIYELLTDGANLSKLVSRRGRAGSTEDAWFSLVVDRFEGRGIELVGAEGVVQSWHLEWNIQEGEKGSGVGLIPPADGGISGVIGRDRSGGQGHVTFYVEVDDLAAYRARAEKLGGRTLVPPTEIAEFGLTFALLADPEGHGVGLSRGVLR
jgi:predicted enzyme related to lactoylglutathione lyase